VSADARAKGEILDNPIKPGGDTEESKNLPMCEFSYSLKLAPYPKTWRPQFLHHGRNAYAYVIGKYGIENFDFISVQLYETNSLALYNTSLDDSSSNKLGEYDPARVPAYVDQLAEKFAKGYRIQVNETTFDDGEMLSEIREFEIKIPKDKLVLGFSFGPKKDNTKFYFDQFRKVNWTNFGGAMFWEIALDGTGFEDPEQKNPKKRLQMAKKLFSALNATRDGTSTPSANTQAEVIL